MTSKALDSVFKLRGFINVKEPRFGVKGDGTTDDTAAIQDALDVGGWVYFPRGTYLTSAALLVDVSGTILFGEGASNASGTTMIKSGDQRTIADDGVGTWEFTAATSGMAFVNCNATGRLAGIWSFRVDTANNFCNVIAPASGVAGGTGALTGTTGVDGELTLKAHTDLKLYLENRSGGQGIYNLTVLSFGLTGQIRDAD